jgi:hypothetical protein
MVKHDFAGRALNPMRECVNGIQLWKEAKQHRKQKKEGMELFSFPEQFYAVYFCDVLEACFN